MATPYRRKGSSSYWADIWFGGKKRSISLKTDNFGLARTMLHDRLASLQRGGLKLPTRTPIGTLLTRFVEHVRNNSRAKSAQTDLYRLREFFGPVCEVLLTNPRRRQPRQRQDAKGQRLKRSVKAYEHAVKIHYAEEVTTSDVSNFLSAMQRTRRLSSKTINEYREVLHRFFRWAIEHQDVRTPGESNPVTAVRRLRSPDPVIRFLTTLDVIRHQLDILKARAQMQTMVAVLIYAGVRRSELLHLTHADVDLQLRRIYVRQKQVDGVHYVPKTGRNRFVPISNALMNYLETYRLAKGSPWFFPSPEGQLWDADNFSHQLADINQKAGLMWNCLDYRHTFGSHLAMKGESLFKIAEIMGNSPEICRRHYACLLPESLVASVEFDTSCVGSA